MLCCLHVHGVIYTYKAATLSTLTTLPCHCPCIWCLGVQVPAYMENLTFRIAACENGEHNSVAVVQINKESYNQTVQPD